jgi:hypothetical protein
MARQMVCAIGADVAKARSRRTQNGGLSFLQVLGDLAERVATTHICESNQSR